MPNSPAVPLPNPEIPLPADSLNLSQVADFKKIFFLDREVFADEVGFFPVGREISMSAGAAIRTMTICAVAFTILVGLSGAPVPRRSGRR